MEEEGWIKSHYCVGGCVCICVCVLCAIPGTALLFTLAKQTKESHLETRRAPGKHCRRVSAPLHPPPLPPLHAQSDRLFAVPSFFPAEAALFAPFAIVLSFFFLSLTPLRGAASFCRRLSLLVARSAWASDKLTGGDFRRTLHLCINSSG